MIPEEVLAAVGKSEDEFLEETSGDSLSGVSLAESIDSAIQSHISQDDGESDRHEFREGIYHASGGWGCVRKRWYGDRGIIKEDWRGFPDGIAHRGNLTEDEVEEGLRSELEEEMSDELIVDNEYPVSVEIDDWEDSIGSFWITGSTDPYVLNEDGDLLEIVEVKSSSNPPNEPKSSHLMQLNTYLSALGLETGTIVYIDPRDWENRLVSPVEQSDSLWEWTKLRHAVYHAHVRRDELPPKSPMGESECDYCAYSVLCARDERGDDYRESDFPPDRSEADRVNLFEISD